VEKKKAAVTTAGQEVVAEEMAPKEGYVDLDGEKQRELKQQQAKPKREPGTKEE
jgi:hypothetical protein